MKKDMLINMLQPEECRIAILEDGVLEELYVERTSHESYVGNIYKGRIVNIEPSIQAAFVDFGVGRNGFLHVSDVEPAYYRHLEPRRSEHGGRRGNDRDRDRDRDRGDRDRGDRDRGRSRGERREGPPRSPQPQPRPDPEIWDLDAVAAEPITHTDAPDAATFFPEAIQEVEALAPLETTAPESQETLQSGFLDDQIVEDVVVPAPQADEPAAPETSDRPAPRRRRSRGGRRRRNDAPPPASDASAESSSAPDVNEAAQPESQSSSERPRLMDSAERRTEDEGESEPERQPLSFSQGHPVSSNIEDEDIFFPRQQEMEPAPAAEQEEEEQVVVQTEEPEEFMPAYEAAETLPPPPRHLDDDDNVGNQIAEEAQEEQMPEFEFEEEEPRPRRRQRNDGRRGDGRRGGRPNGRRMSGRPGAGRPKPLIQDIFRRGQEVLVQVIKEGIGTKGPTLSTYISIAGRYLVLMPGLNRVGVSRKITDEEQRRRLREIFTELKPPKGLGFIIRTAGIDRNKKELQRDLAYLSRLWQVVIRRIRKMKSPAEIYQESDMITRTIRDTFTSDIDTIWVDEPNAYEHAKEFLQIVMPRYANRIKLFTDTEPLFYKHGIEEEIARIQQRHVPLPSGGSIVIDQTEALVAIDVNSGNFRADNNAEETAFRMNLQAAKAIARQLRLRDLGGVIVNDFIDMRDEKHRREVERALRDAVKRDRARTKVLRISQFGIIEMTRQRIRPSLKRSVYQDCLHCQGTGQVKTCESMSIDVMRLLQLAVHRSQIQRLQIRVAEEVANYLHNKKRKDISRMEEQRNVYIQVLGVAGAPPEMLEVVCYDNNNNEVKVLPYGEDHLRRR